MNRLVLIGNGFDLAHGLNTRYEDFINWYWEQRVHGFFGNLTSVSEDPLCTFEIYHTNSITCWNVFAFQYQESFHNKQYYEIIQSIFAQPSQYKVIISLFFTNIIKSVKTKGWVDIENEYYDLLKKYALEEDEESKVDELNEQLRFLQDKLVDYLKGIELKENIIRKDIRPKIYAPICHSDIAVGGARCTERTY